MGIAEGAGECVCVCVCGGGGGGGGHVLNCATYGGEAE